MSDRPAILYCHCQYARVLPEEVKQAVLRRLCASGERFEAVADLCELSARKEPALTRLAAGGPLKIAACYPRAVQWLFAAANAPLREEQTEVVNLRVLPAEEAVAALLERPLSPNLSQAATTSAPRAPSHSGSPI